MLVRIRKGSQAPGFHALLYEPGQPFDYELGEGVPLPAWLEVVPTPEPEKKEKA